MDRGSEGCRHWPSLWAATTLSIVTTVMIGLSCFFLLFYHKNIKQNFFRYSQNAIACSPMKKSCSTFKSPHFFQCSSLHQGELPHNPLLLSGDLRYFIWYLDSTVEAILDGNSHSFNGTGWGKASKIDLYIFALQLLFPRHNIYPVFLPRIIWRETTGEKRKKNNGKRTKKTEIGVMDRFGSSGGWSSDGGGTSWG